VPGLSTTKVGLTRVGLSRVAVLPVGTVVKAHRKVNVSPSTSCDLLPSSCTVASTSTVLSGPALATGREFCVVITTGYCWRTLKEGFIVLLIGSEYVQLK